MQATILDAATGETMAADLPEADRLALAAEAAATRPGRERLARNAPILAALAAIDARTVRPLRAILAAQAAGLPPGDDVARLAALQAEADSLRAGLAS